MHSEVVACGLPLGALVVLGWLAPLAWSDARTGAVSAKGTAIPLVLVGLLRVGLWPPDGAVWPGGVAVTAALAMLVLSDTRWATLPAGVAALGLGLGGPETQVLVGSWFAALLLTLLGIWGAGDGKIFATLLAVFPDARLLGALGLAVTVGSGLAVLRRDGLTTPWVLQAVLHAALRGEFPARTGAVGTHPTVPWLALGTLGYLALRLGGIW